MRERNGEWHLELPELIRVNRLVRGRIDLHGFGQWWDDLSRPQRAALADMLFALAHQARLIDTDYEEALQVSGLSADHAVVVGIWEARQGRHFPDLFAADRFLDSLDDEDLRAVFDLFVALFGIAEGRVYRLETPGCCNHWWHRDLLDERVVQDLLGDPAYFRTSMRDDHRVKNPPAGA